jgi:hypothetical protein
MYDEDGKPEDIVPESVAIRRGMTYRLDRHGKVCDAEIEAPFLIDQLYNHEIIGSDHHFNGVQFITMRKLFLAPVGFKIGMLLVKREDEGQAPDKPIPMEDMDYIRVLRAVRNLAYQRLLQEICDEAAEPAMYLTYGRQGHMVRGAFDALCEAVQKLWDQKKDAADAK